jgi:hypothetical protein
VSGRDRAGDVDEFTRLKNDADPRTIEQMIAEDAYDEIVVEKAERDGDHTTISWDRGTTTSVKGPEVKVGDRVRFYGGASLGDMSHGWALNGKMVEWRTPWERFAERVKWLADYDRRQREGFARAKTQMDARYEALSAPLKARIDRFRAESPDFRVRSEEYEMVACVDADKIADHLRPRVEAGEDPGALVKEFYDLPWAEQLTVGIDEGHSGNTFGGACSLARSLLLGKPV